MTRQWPFSNVAGTRPFSVERIRMSIARLNSWTSVPASAQRAVTSTVIGPAPKPFVSPAGGAVGVIRRMSQSPVDEDQLPAGIVAEAQPSADSTVVGEPAAVFLSTGGATELDAVHTVKWMRNGAFLPEESWSSPASVCSPGPSVPVP